MSPNQGRKIAIVGGSGNIGAVTLSSLLSKNIHTITAITRPDSTATFPAGVIVKKGAYDDEDFLVSALQGQDVLIIQLGAFVLDFQDDLIRASAKAGVKYVLPTEFGCDIAAEKIIAGNPMVWGKAKRRQFIEDLGVSSWVAVVNNPWFDWSLAQGHWGIDIKARKADLWTGGTKANTSTLKQTADGTAGLLSLPDNELAKYKNQPFYISSFYITQREMLDSVQRVTKTTDSDWTIDNRDIVQVAQDCDEVLKSGTDIPAMVTKYYSSHFRQGFGGDYNHKLDLEGFGLVKEDLDEVVKGVVDSVEKS